MRKLMALVLGISIATAAYADPPRYTRKQDLHLDVKPSGRVVPIRPAVAPRRQPSLTADDLMEIEGRRIPIRHEQEAILVDLIRDTPDSDPDKPDYMFRLAEQYATQLRYWHLRSIEDQIAH